MRTKRGTRTGIRLMLIAFLGGGVMFTTACDDSSNLMSGDEASGIVVQQNDLQDISLDELIGEVADDLPLGFGGGGIGYDGDERDRDGNGDDRGRGKDNDRGKGNDRGKDNDRGKGGDVAMRFAAIPFPCLDIDDTQKETIAGFLATYREAVHEAYASYQETVRGLKTDASELTEEEQARMEEIRERLEEIKAANDEIAAEYREQMSELITEINELKREMQSQARDLQMQLRNGDITREEYHDLLAALRQSTGADIEELNAQLREIRQAISDAQADNNAEARELKAELHDLLAKLRGAEIDEEALAAARQELADAIAAARDALLADIESILTDEQLEIWNSWQETGEWPCDDRPVRRHGHGRDRG